MAEIPDYYALLGIDPDASDTDIQAGHRRAASYWHPDRNRSDTASQMMRYVNEAREILLNAGKRRQYNKTSEVYRKWRVERLEKERQEREKREREVEQDRQRREHAAGADQSGQSIPRHSDYYDLLGVDQSATDVEIADAWQRAANFYDPAKNRSPRAGLVFDQFTEARDVLLSPFERSRYDQVLRQSNGESGHERQKSHRRQTKGGSTGTQPPTNSLNTQKVFSTELVLLAVATVVVVGIAIWLSIAASN